MTPPIDEHIETDFLVVGSGIAGLYTGWKLSRLGHVQVITKNKVEESSTQYAQGGIAAVLDKGDSWELHMIDTLNAGDGFCDEKAVRVLVKEGPERVNELIELGTQFDFIEGELDLAREGAHSRRRVLHARGDATGEEIRESLTGVVRNGENIELSERTFLIDMIVNDNRFTGALCWDHEKENLVFYDASYGILASGGCGMVYKNTTNPEVTTGDGVAVAYRSGADIVDMEFIQFHPTALYYPEGVSFLISETVRGEGGYLRNEKGDRFMKEYHEEAELAPRDIVARAIVEETEKSDKENVWLDVTHLDKKYIKGRFPNIYRTLKKKGIDMADDLIPVVPSAHYMIGGVKTDLHGRTSIQNLFACGEVASTGVHGANRLASNSLLEGIVFGHRIFEKIRENGVDSSSVNTDDIELENGSSDDLELRELKKEFRRLMMDKAGIMREKDKLLELIGWLEEKIELIENIEVFNTKGQEVKNMLRVGMLISRSALIREESRGAHYRADHPDKKSEWKDKQVLFNKEHPEGYVR
ncbi:MAG: L-aspartate oxidase [Candidatus Thermoplasmatota archaeon]